MIVSKITGEEEVEEEPLAIGSPENVKHEGKKKKNSPAKKNIFFFFFFRTHWLCSGSL